MIVGRLDRVFSGEGDHEVILSLPLAFLRLIASGVYTYEISWENESWETAVPTSEQLAIIESGLSAVSIAAGGEGIEVGGMVWLSSGLTVASISGTTGSPSQVQVLKSSFPAIAKASGVIMSVRSSTDMETHMTGFQYGSAANQIIHTLQPGDNQYNQFIVQADAVGFKVNLQIFDQTYWSYQFIVNGYWT